MFMGFLVMLMCNCSTTSPRTTSSGTQYLDSSGQIRLADGSILKPDKSVPAQQYSQSTEKRQGRTFWDWWSDMWNPENYDQNLARWYMASGIMANQATAATAYLPQRQAPRTYTVSPAGYGNYYINSY